MSKTKKRNWWEITYLIIFAIVLIYKFLITTMFEIEWPWFTTYLRFGLIAGYTVLKLFFKRKTYLPKEWMVTVLVLILFAIPSFLTTKYSFLIEVACFAVAAKDVDFDKILKVFLSVVSVLLVITLIASLTGFVTDLVYVVEGRGARHSFGIKYTTDFAAYLLYLALGWVVLTERLCAEHAKRASLILALRILVPGGFACVAFYCCHAYTSVFSLVLLTVYAIVESVWPGRVWKQRIIGTLGALAPAIFAALMFCLTKLYASGSAFALKLDTVLSNRLNITARAFAEYPIRLFGTSVEENGLGGVLWVEEEYFFIDSSYPRVLLEFGILIFAIVMIAWIYTGIKARKRARYMLCGALVILALQCFMEHHIFEVAYNVFLMAPCAMLVHGNRAEDK